MLLLVSFPGEVIRFHEYANSNVRFGSSVCSLSEAAMSTKENRSVISLELHTDLTVVSLLQDSIKHLYVTIYVYKRVLQ